MKNTMTQYLLTNYVPICMDFNPMFQFIYEDDMARILMKSLGIKTGVYNVAPSDSVSLKSAKALLKSPVTPIPSFILRSLAKIISNTLWKFPNYLIDYIKYACIVDNSLLLQELAEDPFEYNSHQAVTLCAQS